MRYRWGILGAARINRRLVPAIRAAGDEIVRLGASRRERAEEAARTWKIPAACEGYSPVLEDPGVDVVYLPLANSLHYEWLLAIADAGKHCLAEKPLVLRADRAREVRERFERAGRRYMEAFMWRHHPQVAWLDGQLVEGRLGEAKRVHASFSFRLDRPEDYRWSRAMDGGALADIGTYGVNAARHLFRSEPVAVSFAARAGAGPDGADVSAAGWLSFGGDRLATVSCSLVTAFAQSLEIVGDEGRALVERPWLSVELPAPVRTERSMEERVEEFPAFDAYVAMVEHFRRCVRDASSPLWPAEDGVAQATALEAVRESAAIGGTVVRVAT